MKSFEIKDLKISEIQNLLQNCIAPRPIAFASTIDKEGRPNLSPFSFFNIFSSNPPILIFSPARKGRDGQVKDTFLNVKEVPEVVINMVNTTIIEQVSLSSVEYEKGVNEFEKSGLTMLHSDLVKPFRVKESPVQFECKVNQIIELGQDAGAGNLILCEVLKIHIHDSVFSLDGQIDPIKLNLVGRMGGSYYIKTLPEALFEIPKPISIKAMGIDALPEIIKNSEHFTGNELARLGSIEKLPKGTGKKPTIEDFQKAKELIKEGMIFEAIALLY